MTDSGRLQARVEYFPDQQLRHPRQFFGAAVRDLRDMWQLSGRLASRSIKGRFRRSILEHVWLFITPVAVASVWVFLQSARVVTFGATNVPYPAYVISGMFLWTTFLRMLNSPLQQLNGSRHILKRIPFPWEAMLVAGWVEVVFEFAFYLVVLIAVFLWYGLPLFPLVLALPAVIALLAFGAGAGMLMAPFGLLYEDVPRAMNVVTFLLFFLTPIVYPVPRSMPGRLTVDANPVGVMLVTARETMLNSPLTHRTGFIIISIGTVVMLVFGWLVFRLSKPHVIVRL